MTTADDPAGHVFISYAHEDGPAVDRLVEALEAADLPVWRDIAQLWPGVDWKRAIRRAITDDAVVFIACFSDASVSRSRSYVNEELSLAVEEMRLRPPDVPW